ncbi:MAG TPA: glycosyltransferase [Pyrinomonadaceae bacterium]
MNSERGKNSRMIKVTALTSGSHNPSSRFRVRQFIGPLSNFGIQVTEHYPLVNKYHTKRVLPLALVARLPGVLASRSSRVTWLERELVPGRRTLEGLAGTRRLLDVDDAIWLNAPNSSESLARVCHGVIAGNEFIADYYRKFDVRVWTIPTSLDTARWRPGPPRPGNDWIIGWTGTSSNLGYLYRIEEAVAEFLSQNKQTQLLVVCDRRPVLKKLPSESWRFVRWSAEKEIRLVQEMDVGLMPLPDTEWARGKCALKMIMYLAVGIPAIVSPVGVSKSLLGQSDVGLAARNPNEWFDALRRLFDDRRAAARLGAAGRKLVEEQFSITVNAPKLAAAIREIAASG